MLHQFQTKDFSVYYKLINNIRNWNLISKKTKKQNKKTIGKNKHALVMSTTANNLGLTKHSAHFLHYNDVIMSSMASEITGVAIVCSTVGSGADQRKHHQWRHNGRDGVSNHHPHCLLNRLSSAHQRKHHSSTSLAFVRGIHRWRMNSPHKKPVTRKMFAFDDVIMTVRRPIALFPRWRMESFGKKNYNEY